MDKKLKKSCTCKYHDTEPTYDRIIDGACSWESAGEPHRDCGPDAKLYSPKKRKYGTYTTAEIVAFVNRLLTYIDDSDWRRLEDIFPDEYEREVAECLAGISREPVRCSSCGHWKWNADMSGQCSLQLKGRCDKFYRKDQQWR